MYAVGGTIMAGQSDIEPERNSVHTLVVMKESDDKRRIAAFQNTRAQYIGRPEMSHAPTEELRKELCLGRITKCCSIDLTYYYFSRYLCSNVTKGDNR